MPDFGTDISTFVDGDLDPTFALTSGTRVVAEAVARRLLTPRGGLVGAPDYGIDVRSYLNEAFTTTVAARLQAAIEAEASSDERVQDAAAQVVFNAASQSLAVTVRGTTAVGPFSLVLDVSQLSVALLEAR